MNADEHVSACDRLFLRTKLVRPRAGTFAGHQENVRRLPPFCLSFCLWKAPASFFSALEWISERERHTFKRNRKKESQFGPTISHMLKPIFSRAFLIVSFLNLTSICGSAYVLLLKKLSSLDNKNRHGNGSHLRKLNQMFKQQKHRLTQEYLFELFQFKFVIGTGMVKKINLRNNINNVEQKNSVNDRMS